MVSYKLQHKKAVKKCKNGKREYAVNGSEVDTAILVLKHLLLLYKETVSQVGLELLSACEDLL